MEVHGKSSLDAQVWMLKLINNLITVYEHPELLNCKKYVLQSKQKTCEQSQIFSIQSSMQMTTLAFRPIALLFDWGK